MSTDWFEPIRAYCERGDGAFWAEPVNALSNGAFLVAAAAAAARARAAGDGPALGLAALVGVVGIGSFLFHTLATRWAMLADVGPIVLFIHAYFWLALHRMLGLGAAAATGATLAFLAVSFGLGPALDALLRTSVAAQTNGSADYLPAILALAGVAAGLLSSRGCALGPARRAAGRRLAGVALLFLASLAARTLDQAACAALPLGTHWLWHLLNAGVLYALLAAAVDFRLRARAADAR